MKSKKVKSHHFEILRVAYGSHTKAAAALGITGAYYRQVRASGRMSESLEKLILLLSSFTREDHDHDSDE